MQMKIRILTSVLLVFWLCSAAMASERFLVSSADYKNIILQMYLLDQNKIALEGTKIIPTDSYWGIFSATIVHRKINSASVFDVYFGKCLDMECVEVTLSMKRLDSSLNVQFEKDDILPRDYWWTIAGLSNSRLVQ